jgi:hypothetical protein
MTTTEELRWFAFVEFLHDIDSDMALTEIIHSHSLEDFFAEFQEKSIDLKLFGAVHKIS